LELRNNIKSYQERIILDAFRKHFKDFPKGKLIKSESPDFILKSSPKYSIGIELTALPSSSYIINNETIMAFLTDLQHTISKKEGKLESYRKKRANEYWLVMYADSVEVSGIYLNDFISDLSGWSGFEKIFLFGLFDGQIFGLKNENRNLN
jgi:hypothetical protein